MTNYDVRIEVKSIPTWLNYKQIYSLQKKDLGDMLTFNSIYSAPVVLNYHELVHILQRCWAK